ncbi:MAG: hypothetical protein DRJ60_07900 [Thermoprotei archaeon]|nr:MAG: hypothetical protein DRJ60_07900 [Thermoprotei archaeon]
MPFFKYLDYKFYFDKIVFKDSLFIVVSGSHAYGWNTENSDLDLVRVFYPTVRQALSVMFRCKNNHFKDKFNNKIVDCTEYPIQNFISLLSKGNGNVLDNLFQSSNNELCIIRQDKEVKELQKIVIDELHDGFRKHFLGYDMSLKKDLSNESRLEKYGMNKLLLSRYRLLQEGIILCEHKEVVYNLLKQMEYIDTKYCEDLLNSYIESRKFYRYKNCIVEIEELRQKLESLQLPKYSGLPYCLDTWLIDKYIAMK